MCKFGLQRFWLQNGFRFFLSKRRRGGRAHLQPLPMSDRQRSQGCSSDPLLWKDCRSTVASEWAQSEISQIILCSKFLLKAFSVA